MLHTHMQWVNQTMLMENHTIPKQIVRAFVYADTCGLLDLRDARTSVRVPSYLRQQPLHGYKLGKHNRNEKSAWSGIHRLRICE